MTLEKVLTTLRERGVRLWAEGDDLRYEAPAGALDDRVITAIRARRPEILAYLRRAAAMPRPHETIPRVAPGGEPLRPSFAQQRLWFLDQLQPGASEYCWNITRRLRGRLDVDAFERALATIYERHEVLRARFQEIDGEPRVTIDDVARLELQCVDLPGDCEENRAEAARRAARAEVLRPFDLKHGPLVRAHVMQLDREDHVLVLAMHHIVSDGWSLGVLNHELGALYTAFTRGEPSPLPPLVVQYADFATWHRSWMSGEVLERHLDYWRETLASVGLLELPTDRPRPVKQTFVAARVDLVLPTDLWAGLEALSRHEGATPFMTLLAAFGVLLQRYARQDDIAVGSPIANRNRVETEGLIGFFVNTLVMRIDLSGTPTFRELVSRVRSAALGAYQHQDLPFEKLVDELQPQRDLSRNPLFQVIFAVQNAPGHDLDLPDLEIARFDLGIASTHFDLEVHVSETPQGPTARFIYNTDLFDAATIERMACHYQNLLRRIVATPDSRISELPMLDDAERHRILAEWNDTATPYPRGACIHELFEAQAEDTPDAVAAAFDDQTITYEALNRRANQVAHHLGGLGIGPHMRVGIAIERSVEMVVGILGVLKAGGAYVPLDPGYPAERLSYILQDTQAAVVLTTAHLESQLPDYEGTVVRLDADASLLAAQPEANLAPSTEAASLAYVIYTSGSTGQPKGVCVSHRNVVRLVREADFVTLGPGEVMLQFAPISFDASTFELWGSLLNGARLEIFPPHRPTLAELGCFIEDRGVSTLWLTAALFQQMADARPDCLRGVRQLLAGGETLSAPHVRQILARLGPDQRLINGYGPTENTTFTCCHRMRAGAAFGRSVPIGRPIADTTVYVLDRHLEPAPIGVPGRLYAGGDGVARGYLNDPRLTAARFIPDPFGDEPGACLYDTGDLARRRPDGTIEFLGRDDDQVKIRGFRVELGEIEAALTELPMVSAAAVTTRKDENASRRLVAYVAPVDGATPTSSDLRLALARQLPEYMIPTQYVMLETLPMNANGKIDRGALPEPEGIASETEYVPPRTPTERRLVDIWASFLPVERVGIHDNFFDLGGHSLVATRVLNQARAQTGVDLALACLFDAPTVAGLAAAIDTLREVTKGGNESPSTDRETLLL